MRAFAKDKHDPNGSGSPNAQIMFHETMINPSDERAPQFSCRHLRTRLPCVTLVTDLLPTKPLSKIMIFCPLISASIPVYRIFQGSIRHVASQLRAGAFCGTVVSTLSMAYKSQTVIRGKWVDQPGRSSQFGCAASWALREG
jgi:hypothetical protein